MKFDGLSVSDCHTGIARIPVLEMNMVLHDAIISNLENVKILFICGDFFDRPLSLSNSGTFTSIDLIYSILKYCERHSIIVRILRGTYTHDRIQLEYVMRLVELSDMKLNIRYFDTINVEYIKELDISVGYLPDDLPYKTSDNVITTLKEKMTINNFDKLDYVIAHGYFDHVLPPECKPRIVYSYKQFDFVKKCVFVGHVHTPSSHKNIYYNGSTNRLAFNEEEPKGLLRFTNNDDKFTVQFIENKQAHIFKTLDYSNVSNDDILKKFKNDISKYVNTKQTVYIRVVHSDPVIRSSLQTYVYSNYENIIFTHIAKKKKITNVEIDNLQIDIPTKTYVVDNLPSDIHEGLKQYKLNPISVEEIESLISQFL